ncbi:MAG TPA: signal peptidase I [Chthoniobacteraceae bacterium]|nr:signal peptidase I [Chthoniobacteraceae bacterium]
MIGWFTPRYLKDGREVHKAAAKLLAYRRDLLPPEVVAEIEKELENLRQALKERRKEGVEEVSGRLDQLFGQHFPQHKHHAFRENCEVILVALVVAVGVRSYFIQPFTIPTGSMQPTLNGIISHVTEEPPPGPLVRAAHLLLYGRDYVNLVSEVDDEVVDIRPVKRFGIFNFSLVQCRRQSFTVHVPPDKLMRDFHVLKGRPLKAGEVFARGYVNTGDHVFVDKFSYHFRAPKRGEIFVFNTAGIRDITPHGEPSQFYIKRLAGLPGDELRIDPPNLYINGQKASEPGFLRVMAAKDGYRGYSNGDTRGNRFPYLGSPEATFHVPRKAYFALGDNSYDSSDSRRFKTVPEHNLTGRGFLVYWPFTSHWGLMK